MLILFLLISAARVSGQCWVSMLVDSIAVDTVEICQGDSVSFSFVGECILVDDNFNSGQLGDDWGFVTPGHVFQAPCDTMEEMVCLWFGDSSHVMRVLETVDLDLTSGADIFFSMKFGLQNDPPSCEGPDEMREGVSLQYSIDQGNSWIDIVYFCPDGSLLPTNPLIQSPLTYTPTQFTSWGDYSFNIPPQAQTPNTRLRWMQAYCSYFNNHYDDNWGVDNVKITRAFSQDIEWSTGAGSATSIVVLPIQTSTYYVYILGGGIIPDTLAIDSIVVYVHPVPQPEISGDLEICLGDTTQLSAAGNFTYQWSNGFTSSSVVLAPSITTTYQLTATDYLGCTGTVPVTLVVHPLPLAHAIGDTVCEGEIAHLSASGGISYAWSNQQSGPVIIIDPAIAGNYLVTVTDQHGCRKTAAALLSVNPPPTVSLTNDTTICFGESIILSAAGGQTYFWNNGSQSTSIQVSPPTNAIYSVTVIDSKGCQSTAEMQLYVAPRMNVQISSEFDTICRGAEITLLAHGADFYVWSTGAKTASITVQPGYTTPYQLSGTSYFNGVACSAEDTWWVNVKECSALFFANAICPKGYNPVFKPVGDFSTIYNYSLRVFDRWGKLLFTSNNPELGWDGTFLGEFLPAGVYIYQVQYVKSIINEPFEKIGTLTIVE